MKEEVILSGTKNPMKLSLRSIERAVVIFLLSIFFTLFLSHSLFSVGFTGDFSQSDGAVYNGGSDDGANGIAIDTISIGGPYIYVVGTSSSNCFTVKYNAFGIMLTSATFNSGSNNKGIDIAVDNFGNVYVTSKLNNDYFTVKYDNNLVFQSSAVFNSGGYNDWGYIVVNNSGDVYVTGISNYNCHTVKYNNNLVYQTSVSGEYQYRSRDIATDSSGNIFITGDLWESQDNYDYLTIKYNSNLVFQSSAVFNSGSDDYAYGIVIDNSGNVYITGTVRSGGTWGDNVHFTIKYNSFLQVISSATYTHSISWWDTPNACGRGIAIDNNGSVYVTGFSDNRVINNVSLNDYLTIKYNSNLVFQSSAVFNGGYEDDAYGIAVDNSGNVYITGKSFNGSNFDFRTLKYPSSVFGSYIKGVVKDTFGDAMSGITMNLTAASQGIAITNNSGYYEFLNLSAGTYTITPTKTKCTFTPFSRTIASLIENTDNWNFVGTYNVLIEPGGLKLYNNLFDPSKGEKVYIKYELPEPRNVTITINNFAGREIKRIIDNQPLSTGVHASAWDGKNIDDEVVASGTYIVYIRAGSYKEKKKVLVIK